MTKYRKRPEVIEAFRWEPGTMTEIVNPCSGPGVCGTCGCKMDEHGSMGGVLICTGDMIANVSGGWKVYKARDFVKQFDYVGE